MRKSSSLLSLALLSAALLPAAPVYTITNLGFLPGKSSSVAWGLNANGTVVGNSGGVPFVWSSGVMSAVPGVTSGGAFGINDSGHIVGSDYSGNTRAFYYNTVTTTLIGPGVQNEAFAINNSNEIVGNSSAGAWHSVAGAAASILADLATLSSSSEARAISNSGQIAGGVYLPGGPPYSKHPTLWSSFGGVPQDLGLFQPAGSAAAQGMNNLGQVVGSSPAPGNLFLPYVWSGGVMTSLGTLGGSLGTAYDINDAGFVVGISTLNGFSNHRAFVHDGTAMYNLNSLLLNGAGWMLESAHAINNSGQIVGYGYFNGGAQTAFLLTPSAVPEPGTWALMAAGLGAAALRRRRRA